MIGTPRLQDQGGVGYQVACYLSQNAALRSHQMNAMLIGGLQLARLTILLPRFSPR